MEVKKSPMSPGLNSSKNLNTSQQQQIAIPGQSSQEAHLVENFGGADPEDPRFKPDKEQQKKEMKLLDGFTFTEFAML